MRSGIRVALYGVVRQLPHPDARVAGHPANTPACAPGGGNVPPSRLSFRSGCSWLVVRRGPNRWFVLSAVRRATNSDELGVKRKNDELRRRTMNYGYNGRYCECPKGASQYVVV